MNPLVGELQAVASQVLFLYSKAHQAWGEVLGLVLLKVALAGTTQVDQGAWFAPPPPAQADGDLMEGPRLSISPGPLWSLSSTFSFTLHPRARTHSLRPPAHTHLALVPKTASMDAPAL